MKSSLVGLLVAAGILYLAKEVLIPLAVAILFSFLLAPAVRRVERWHCGRLGSTLIVVSLAFAALVAVGAIAASQAVSLAAKLPEYRHNIVAKIYELRHPKRDSTIGKAAEAIKELEEQAAPERPPLPVKETPATPIEAFVEFAAPVAKPVAMALAIFVFTILLLLDRENMRERLIGLIGRGRIHVTTRAMAEASHRVSGYLAMQVVVNSLFGIPFGIALYFIGVPNALLWGLLGTLLRFVPYVGVWIAAAMPALLAFAIADGWSMLLWTLAVFLALELVLVNALEPYLYGRSAGLSPIAIIMAAIFWTWLWGPVGLLLATPLTVVVAVIGRHIPELGYLNVLLGVEPVLSPEERFYQRLLALDAEEAAELAESHAVAHGAANTLDRVLVPALAAAARDRARGAIEPTRERFILGEIQRIAEELEIAPAATAALPVCIVAAHDEGDHAAALLLARLVGIEASCVIGAPALPAEVVEVAAKRRCRAVVISSVPPRAASRAGRLAGRLHRQLPDVRLIAGLWGAEDDVARSRERLLALGIDAVISRLSEAVELLRRQGAKTE